MPELFQLFTQLSESVAGFAGISLGMMLAIFALSALIIRVTQIRDLETEYEKTLIGVVVLAVSAGAVYVSQEFETWRMFVKDALIAGGVSSFAYQIFKPVFKRGSKYLVQKFKERTSLPYQREQEVEALEKRIGELESTLKEKDEKADEEVDKGSDSEEVEADVKEKEEIDGKKEASQKKQKEQKE